MAKDEGGAILPEIKVGGFGEVLQGAHVDPGSDQQCPDFARSHITG